MAITIKNIKNIVNELLNNSLNADSTNIDINLSLTDEDVTIKISDNGKGMNKDQLAYANKVLNQSFKKELEEQFGELAGTDTSAGGLNIIGLQVHEATVESVEGEGTKITLTKHKN